MTQKFWQPPVTPPGGFFSFLFLWVWSQLWTLELLENVQFFTFKYCFEYLNKLNKDADLRFKGLFKNGTFFQYKLLLFLKLRRYLQRFLNKLNVCYINEEICFLNMQQLLNFLGKIIKLKWFCFGNDRNPEKTKKRITKYCDTEILGKEWAIHKLIQFTTFLGETTSGLKL